MIDEQELSHSLAGLLEATHTQRPTQPLLDQLRRVVAAADDVLGVDGVGVLLLDDRDAVRSVASSGPRGRALEMAQQELGVGPGVDTVRHGRTVVVTDLARGAYAALAERLFETPVRAVVSAPIRVRDRVVGNLNVLRAEPGEWSAGQVRAAEAFAELIGVLLRMSSAGGPPAASALVGSDDAARLPFPGRAEGSNP